MRKRTSSPIALNLWLPSEIEGSVEIPFTYPEKPLLTFLKEKGVKLNAEQEAIRQKQEKLAGQEIKITLAELQEDDRKTSALFKQEEKLVKEYMDYINKQKPSQKEKSQQEEDRASITMEQKYEEKKNAIIARLCNTPNPLLWQIAKVRRLTYDLQNIKTKTIAREYIDSLKQEFTAPFLVAETEQLFENILRKMLNHTNSRKAKQPTFSAISSRIIRAKYYLLTFGPLAAGLAVAE